MTQITTEQAKKATIELAKDMNGIESPIKKSPDFTKVTAFGKKYGKKAESVVKSTPGAVIFGRTVEIGQMPDSNIKSRGYTKDVDIFVPNQVKFVKRAKKTLGKEYRVTKRESGNYLIERNDGKDAFDVHTKPDTYTKSQKTEGYVNALPSSTSDILKKSGISQEKLYVQAKRKAVATLGNSNDYTPRYKKNQTRKIQYGPSSHRIKDPYDLIRYGQYFATVKTKQLQSQPSSKKSRELAKIHRIQTNVNTIKQYFSQPKVYNKYEEGSSFGKKFKSFKATKPTHNKPKPIQRKRSHAEKFSRNLLGW